VVLTFESVDEILWCDHSNKTSSAVLSHGTICFVGFETVKFRIFLEFLLWPLTGVKGLKKKQQFDLLVIQLPLFLGIIHLCSLQAASCSLSKLL